MRPPARSTYQLGRFAVAADVELPLPPAQLTAPSCTVAAFGIETANVEPIRNYHRAGSEGGFLARADSAYVMELPGGKFHLDLQRRRIDYLAAEPPVDLLIDTVLPEFLGGLGELVLHGSAVLIDERAVLLVGRSGAGKSTLALALSKRGRTVLCDDFIPVLDAESVGPGSRALNVWEDSAERTGAVAARRTGAGKASVAGNHPIPPRSRIGAILFLDPTGSGGAELQDVPRDESLARLMESRYLLDPHSPAEIGSHLERVAELLEHNQPARLRYRHDYAALPRVIDLIEQAVTQLV